MYSIGLLASIDVLYRAAGKSSCTLSGCWQVLMYSIGLLASLDVLYRAAGKS